jgi:hypothetical protein
MATRIRRLRLVSAPVAALSVALFGLGPVSQADASSVAPAASRPVLAHRAAPAVYPGKARHPRTAPRHVAGPEITYHPPAAAPRSRLTARQRAEVRASMLSRAWSHVFHPKGATRGVVALRAEPLRNPPEQVPSRRHLPATKPLQCTVPTAPGGVAATSGANEARVTWTAANGNGNTITGYVIREASGPDRGTSIATSGTALTATLTGLAGGSAATFSVIAESSCGAGPAGTSSPATPTGVATTYVGTVLGNSPAAFYRLDEPAGATVMADSSGNAADGAYSGQETLGTSAPLASDPATSAGYTTCCSALGTGQPALPRYAAGRTVEAWINTTDGTTNQAVAGWGGTSTDEAFIVSISAQSINVDGWNDYLSFPVVRPLDTGQWHLLTVTFDGTNVTAYLDGQEVGTGPFAGTPNTLDPSGIELAGFSDYNFFQGDLADVAVYPSVLTAATVASHFSAAGYAVPTAPADVHVFYGGPNGADVTWGHATAKGTGVTGYLVTALKGSTREDAITENADATAARVTGLAPGSYTFQVVALDAYGAGPAATTTSFSATGASSTYASATLADSPTVFYKLADSDANAMADSSGNGATGYYTSAATLGVTGPLASDPATAISDSNGGPAASGQPALPLYSSSRTVEGWINTTYTAEQFLASYGVESSGEGFTVAIQPDDVIVSGWGDDLTFTSPAALDNGIWHFIAATTNGTGATVYVDGVSLGTQNFPSELNTLPAPQGFEVGAAEQGCCGYFDGDLANVAVFPSVLSSAQVTAQFAASGLGRPPAPAAPSAVAGANRATVSWQAAAASDPPITGYLVTAKEGNSQVNAISAPATATSAIVTGLAGGTAYTFTIQAINEYGTGTAATTAPVTPTGSASTYASTVLTSSPSVFYRLADADLGATADSSGHAATGSYNTASATLGKPGPLGNDAAAAVADNGDGPVASGYPSLPLYASARTLEGWFNTTGSGTQWLAGYGTDSTSEGFGVGIQPDDVYVSGYNDDVTFTSPALLDDGNWHFVVVTTTGSSATVYVDGVSLGTQNLGQALDTVASPQGLDVGAGIQGCCGYFSGSLADVAVFPTTLTAATVTSQFAASGLARPGAPGSPAATAGANQATVSWSAPAGADPAVTGYLVTAKHGTTAVNSVSVRAAATSTTVTGLAGGTAYTFSIQALNTYGAGTAATTTSVTPSGASSTYASTTLADSPSVFYRLADSDAGAMADSSGSGATGSYRAAAATLGQAGPLPNDAATSVGDNGNGPAASGYPSLPLHNGSRTLEGWINTSSGGTQWLAGYGVDSTSEGFGVGIQPDDVYVSGYNDDLTFTAPSPLDDGSWHFIVVTTNGSSATVYVDGLSLGTQIFADTLDTLSSVQGFDVGADAQGCCGYYSGALADVAVFPSALTAAQISAQFAASGLGRPGAPGAPAAKAGANQATVSWSAPSGASSAITGYLITAVKGSTAVNSVSAAATATSVTLTGLAGGTAYTFTIRAINRYGAGSAATAAAVTPTGAASTYASTVLSSSPSVFYRLADGDLGAMADSSASGATGSYSTSVATLGQSGPLANDSAASSGDNGAGPLAAGHPSIPLYSSSRTVEGWINTTSGGEDYLAGYGNTSTAEGFAIATEPDQVIVSGYGDDLGFTTAAPLNDGDWHFIVVTTNGTTATVYMDGLSLGTKHFPDPLDTLPTASGFQVGSGAESCCGYFDGDLADVAVFPSVLSAATVTAQFTASGLGRPPAPASPVATAGANQATVSWTAPAGGHPAVTGYLVTAMKGTTAVNAVSVAATSNSTTLTGLNGSTAYTFHVSALNEYGAGPAAATTAITPTGAASTFASTVLSGSPSVFYRLADTDEGAMADSSGHGATGVYNPSAVTLGHAGPLANDIAPAAADNADGPLASGRPALPLYNQPRTLEGWFTTASGAEQPFASYGLESDDEGFVVETEPDDVIVSGWGDDLTFATTSAINNGSWHFLVVTANGTSATVYVDGTAIGTQTFPVTLDTLAAPQGFEVGSGEQGCCGYFSGDLADIAVFPSALTAAQVTAQYKASGVSASRRNTSRHITPQPHSRPAVSRVTGGRS